MLGKVRKIQVEVQPHNVIGDPSSLVFRSEHLSAYAARVVHGSVPALAWRVEIGGKSIVFSGDTNGEGTGLVQLAKDADIFIAHNAVPEGATGVERRLHMPPFRHWTDRRRGARQATRVISSDAPHIR